MDSNMADLPHDSDNFDVFCERCQKVHRYYTFTQEDLQRVISDGAKALADKIDADLLANAERLWHV